MANDETHNMKFFANAIPTLQSGTYTITVCQQVKGTDAKNNDFTGEFTDEKKFYVSGEQFSLDPATVYAVYPPQNFQGDVSTRLPHIILTKKTLPWQRSVESNSNKEQKPPSPWLALLLFEEGDPAPEIKEMKFSDLLKDNLPANTVSYPIKELSYGQSPDDHCQVIDVETRLFEQIAPTLEDLPYLAHVRRVDVSNKEDSPMNMAAANNTTDHGENGQTTRDFSAVICNRRPAVGKRSTVHLVSLENMRQYLPKGNGNPNPNNAGYVRLVSLYSWSFETTEAQKGIKEIAKNWNTSPITLRLPALNGTGENSAPEINKAFELGYVPLHHTLRTSDKTVSWYRGPFIPYQAGHPQSRTHISSADAATRYNPDTGMFDVSYAAAWQLGRLLALQDKGFSLALYNWKQGYKQETIKEEQGEILRETLLPQERVEATKGRSLQRATTMSLSAEIVNQVIAPALSKFFNIKPSETAQDALKSEETLREPGGQEDSSIPDELVTWIARLSLLYGVPLNYLVAAEAMLPMESIRFFYLDPNWVAALVDGAYSIGRVTESDRVPDKFFWEKIHPKARVAATSIRACSRHTLTKTPKNDDEITITGFLFRSELVSGWPGLEIRGFSDKQPNKQSELRLLRLERLLPNVLLALFEGELNCLKLHGPPEGLCFGFEREEQGKLFIKFPKDSSDGKIDIPMRAGEKNVVNVTKLADNIGNSADFASKMIEGTEVVVINKKANSQ